MSIFDMLHLHRNDEERIIFLGNFKLEGTICQQNGRNKKEIKEY